MILTLDVGNSQIFGGVFRQGELMVRFRKPSRPPTSSDELGLFLRAVLRENETDPSGVEQIAFCSVVPDAAAGELRREGFIVDYVDDRNGRRLGAVRMGDVRLIDNFKLGDGR